MLAAVTQKAPPACEQTPFELTFLHRLEKCTRICVGLFRAAGSRPRAWSKKQARLRSRRSCRALQEAAGGVLERLNRTHCTMLGCSCVARLSTMDAICEDVITFRTKTSNHSPGVSSGRLAPMTTTTELVSFKAAFSAM